MTRANHTLLGIAVILAVALGAGGGAPARADEAAAKAAFQEGERAFQLGRFEDAVVAYERAFTLDPQPAFVYNVALAHKRQYELDGKLDHLLRARELFRNYLRLDPQSPRRAGVEKLLVDLGAKIEAARAHGEPPAVTSPPPSALTLSPSSSSTSPSSSLSSSLASQPPPPPPSSHKTAYLVGGAAVLAAAVLTVFLVSAHGSKEQFDGPGIDLTPR